MPADFGEIANYHNRLATRHLVLARIAREAGDLSAADYQAQMAARYIEAAEEQKMAMSQPASRPATHPAQSPWALKPEPSPVADIRRAALPRLFRQFAAAIGQFIPSREAPFQGLSLN